MTLTISPEAEAQSEAECIIADLRHSNAKLSQLFQWQCERTTSTHNLESKPFTINSRLVAWFFITRIAEYKASLQASDKPLQRKLWPQEPKQNKNHKNHKKAVNKQNTQAAMWTLEQRLGTTPFFHHTSYHAPLPCAWPSCTWQCFIHPFDSHEGFSKPQWTILIMTKHELLHQCSRMQCRSFLAPPALDNVHLTRLHSSFWFTWRFQWTTVNTTTAWGPCSMSLASFESFLKKPAMEKVNHTESFVSTYRANNKERATSAVTKCISGTHGSHQQHGSAASLHPHRHTRRSIGHRLQRAQVIDAGLHCLIMLIVKWHGRSTMHTTRVTHITSGSLIWPSYNGSARAWTSSARSSCSPSAHGTWLKSTVKQNLFIKVSRQWKTCSHPFSMNTLNEIIQTFLNCSQNTLCEAHPACSSSWDFLDRPLGPLMHSSAGDWSSSEVSQGQTNHL